MLLLHVLRDRVAPAAVRTLPAPAVGICVAPDYKLLQERLDLRRVPHCEAGLGGLHLGADKHAKAWTARHACMHGCTSRTVGHRDCITCSMRFARPTFPGLLQGPEGILISVVVPDVDGHHVRLVLQRQDVQ